MSVAVVFETHSTSVDNELGIATGWNQGELSDIGREQARELGERRRDDGIAVVFTSDLRRAVQTAELAFAGTPLPVIRDARLRECDYGDAERHAAERDWTQSGADGSTSRGRGRKLATGRRSRRRLPGRARADA